ncbi:hypothetical protein IM880_19950 [Pectobacterium polaris]|uniref:Uncharacterized protein n=1 Tax=Pectobacterium polaris TaxID=2042057 RepID=A0AAW4P4Z4_9GAMM|nr:hypothetical protein [Pectobacterium polaris]
MSNPTTVPTNENATVITVAFLFIQRYLFTVLAQRVLLFRQQLLVTIWLTATI